MLELLGWLRRGALSPCLPLTIAALSPMLIYSGTQSTPTSPSQRAGGQQLQGNENGEGLVLHGTEGQCAIPRRSQCQVRQPTLDLSETN